jgi:glucosyl-dolichyl phosphate glucuronosyltransferase
VEERSQRHVLQNSWGGNQRTSTESKTPDEPTRSALSASVIVCAYTEDRLSQIHMALGSVARQTVPPCQVIVVADYSSALYERLDAEYPDFEVVYNEFQRGLSGARNTGVKHAAGEVIVFLDDDARAERDWIEKLLTPYEDESVVGVGGLVLADWGSMKRPIWLPDEFLWVVGCSYKGLPETRAWIRNPLGANMSFRRSAFDRAGLFDPAIGRNSGDTRPLGCEETEFSIRLLEAWPGARIIYDPEAVVHHHVDRSRRTWRYFLGRCFAEGYSKAHVAGISGTAAALSSERSYMIRTITRAAYRELRALLRPGGRNALGRLAALVLGVSWTAAGYMRATVAHENMFHQEGGCE